MGPSSLRAWIAFVFLLAGTGVALPVHASGRDAPPPEPETIDDSFAGEEHEMPSPPPEPTKVLSKVDAARLRALEGVTLQWISYNQPGRGAASVTVDEAGVWRLNGEQTGAGDASLVVEGFITEIGRDYFVLEGAVTIVNTPDEGRTCEGYGPWRFEVTQNRKYYRLRQFEWCDQLTDYVDFYF
jgi:hypothetical protein